MVTVATVGDHAWRAGRGGRGAAHGQAPGGRVEAKTLLWFPWAGEGEAGQAGSGLAAGGSYRGLWSPECC